MDDEVEHYLNMNNPRFFLKRANYGDWELLFGGYSEDKQYRYVSKPVEVTLEKVDSQALRVEPIPPLMTFSDFDSAGRVALQSLMDTLWDNGFRPADIGTAGHLAATQKHLDDMRALVSKAHDVNLK